MVTPRATHGDITEPISTTQPNQPITPKTIVIGKMLVRNISTPLLESEGKLIPDSHVDHVRIRKPGTVMTTAAVLGLFRRNDKTRAEFFAHLSRPAPGA